MTEQDHPFTISSDKLMAVTAVDIRSTATITIPGANGPLVTIHMDGRLEYGPGYEPDEAARLFWDAMRRYVPSPAEKQFGRPLMQQVDEELARGREAEATVERVRQALDYCDRGSAIAIRRALDGGAA